MRAPKVMSIWGRTGNLEDWIRDLKLLVEAIGSRISRSTR